MNAAKYTNETYAAATLRTSSVFGLVGGVSMAKRSGLIRNWPRVGQLPEDPQSPGCIGHRADTDTVAVMRPS